MTQRYSDGTVTVSNGSTTVTGTGTAWEVALVTGGFLVVGADLAIIDEVVSDTEITLAHPWAGDSVSGAAYDIVLESAEAARTIIANRQLADIIARINAGIALDDIGAMGALAERDDYDDEPQGFIYGVTDDASGELVVYVKNSPTTGDWAGPFQWRGPEGPAGPQGPRGDGYDYTGQGAPSAGIGSDGSTYLDTDTGDTYTKSGGVWSLTGSIRGPQGLDGTDPGVLMDFDTGTTDADPGSGNLRADNSDMSAATELYVSKTNRGGSDVSAWLLALDDSTSTVKGQFVITDPATGEQATFDVTGVTDATGYVKVAVSNHSGETSFADETPISLQFARTGDAGTGTVSSVNGYSGNVTLDADDIDDSTTTNKFVTEAQRDAIDTAVQPADIADMLESSDIGATVQPYNADTPTQQVSGGEITAGTETAVRSWSPADVKAAAEAFGGDPNAYTPSNILGTVSESGGVPTGAIIERGSNANGEYVRYADGTQICWATGIGSLDSSSSIGNIYGSSSTHTWTYPAAFSGTPSIAASIPGASTRWAGVPNISSSAAELKVFGATTSGVTSSVCAIAVGRWF